MRTSRRLLSAAATVALTAGVLATTSATATATATPAHRATPFEVTAKASTTELVRGKKVTIHGKVSPKAKGEKDVLEQKIGKTAWKRTGSATLNKRGHYEVSDKPSSMNPRKYRVVKAASAKHKKGVSKSVAVTVFKWHDVYDLQARSIDSFYRAPRWMTINGVKFPHSLWGHNYGSAEPTGSIDYNIERQCITLKSTYGMADRADTGSSVKIDVLGDGSELFTGTFALFESQAKTLDLHGVFRLAFQYTPLTEAKAFPTIASPKVLCSF
jgi:hypothetical protein